MSINKYRNQELSSYFKRLRLHKSEHATVMTPLLLAFAEVDVRFDASTANALTPTLHAGLSLVTSCLHTPL
jgi:hypothetical protein